jgi:hypothetical protein
MRESLNLSVIGAVVGIGCVGLSACTARIRPTLLLAATVGAFAFAAWASFRSGLVIMPLVDVVLMVVPIGLLMVE